MQTVLLVDPDPEFLEWAQGQLTAPTVRVLVATDAEKALQLYQSRRPDIVMAEVRITPFTGLDLLRRIRQTEPNAIVLLTSAFATTHSVIESTKLGAFDFIRKESLPFTLKMVVDAALKAQAELQSATELTPELTVEQHKESIIGRSEAMQKVFKMIGRVAASDAPVLITGESGSGKELVARAIHNHSVREGQFYVAINCAAIPENLLESELFGHEKGAFTGAVAQRIGRFEQCSKGTLFMDEIGDMPLPVQAKILRVLQDGEFSRVGSNGQLTTNARIIAATNKDLEDEVVRKTFREDLFYRLNVVRVHIPPLRERPEDIRLLADYFLQRISSEKHIPRLRLSEEAARMLENHHWPGNVRELENTIQRTVVLATADVILPKDIPLGSAAPTPAATSGFTSESRPPEPAATPATAPGVVQQPPTNGHAPEPAAAPTLAPTGFSARPTKDEAINVLLQMAEADPRLQLLPWLERELTIYAMRKTGGNQVKSAQLLGVTRATLRKRIERFSITKELNIK